MGTSYTTSGEYTLAADIANSAATGGERTIMVINAAQNRSVTAGWVAGNLVFEGAYAGHDPVPTGFSTGNIKIQLTFDVDSETGSVGWWDIDDPGDLSTRGDVSLGAFTGASGSYDTMYIIMPFLTLTTSGFDNISLATGVLAVCSGSRRRWLCWPPVSWACSATREEAEVSIGRAAQ